MTTEEKIGKILLEKGLTISTAESCTGGLLSSRLTDVAGSSAYITLNLVTYSVEAKNKMLKVVLDNIDVVSEDCAYQMAKGLYNLTGSDICVSTTGNAGPTGNPVGLMYSTIYTPQKYRNYKIVLPSNIERIEMKKKFTEAVLNTLCEFLTSL